VTTGLPISPHTHTIATIQNQADPVATEVADGEMTEADPLAEDKASSPAASKENEAASKALVQKKASKRQLTPLGTRPAAEDNATGTTTTATTAAAAEGEKGEEYTLQYRKPTRTAKKRPAYKLSVGLIDTYNCINEVSSQNISAVCEHFCLIFLFFLSALLRQEEKQTVQ
jgi:hypothetical protein